MTITGTAFGSNQANAGNVNLNPGSITSAAGDVVVAVYVWYDNGTAITQTAGSVSSTPSKTFTKDTEFLQTPAGGHLGIAVFSWVSDGTTLTQINCSPSASGSGVGSVGGSALRIVSTVGTVTYDSTTKGTGTDGITPITWSAGGAISGTQVGILAVTIDNGASGAFTTSSGYTNMNSFGNGSSSIVNLESFKVNETGTPSLSVAYNTTINSAIELFVSYKESSPPAVGYTGPGVVRLEDNSEILQEVGNPPTFVAVGAENFTSTSVPITPHNPTGNIGDFCLLYWESDTPGDQAVASGWTQGLTGAYGASNHAYGFLSKFDNTTGNANVTVTGLNAAPFTDTWIIRYSGVDPNSPINVAQLDPAGAIAQNLTTTRPDTVEIVAITDDLGVTNSPPAGWTGRLTTAAGNFFSADRLHTSTGQTGATSGWPHGGANNGIIHLTLNGVPSTVRSPLHLVLEAGVEGSWTGSGTALTEAGFQVQLEDGSSKIVFEAAALDVLVQENGRYFLTEAGDHVLIEGAGGGGGTTFNEPFTYSNGALPTVSSGLWTSVSGNEVQVVSNKGSSNNATAAARDNDSALHGLTLNTQMQLDADVYCALNVGAGGVGFYLLNSSTFNGYTIFIGNSVHIYVVNGGVLGAALTNDARPGSGGGGALANHVTWTWVQSTGAIKVYLDGTLWSSATDSTYSDLGNEVIIELYDDDAGAPTREATIDSLVISPTISGGISRSITDTASGTDAITRSLVLARSITDTGVGTDAVARALAQTRAITDTASGTDAVTRSRVSTRSITDTGAGTDALTRSLVEARSVTDAASGTDAVTRTRVSTRSITDTASGTDSITTRTLVQSRSITDSAPASDVAVPPSTVRPITDTASGTDAITRTAVFTRALTDTAAGTDAVTRTRGSTRSISDAANGTDALTRALVESRSISDTAAGTDAVTRTRVSTRSIVDSAPAADALTRTSASTRALTDTAAGSDAVTRLDTYTRSITDAAGGTDAVTRTRSFTRSISDSAAGSDSVTTRTLVQVRSITDSAPTSETIVSSKGPTRFINDNALATEVITRSLVLAPRALADTAAGTDSVTRVGVRTRAVSDAAGGTDVITRTAAKTRAISDSALATDAVTRSRASVRAVGDSAFGVDTVTRTLTTSRAVGDSAPATDTARKVIIVFITDSAGGIDSAVGVLVRAVLSIRRTSHMTPVGARTSAAATRTTSRLSRFGGDT